MGDNKMGISVIIASHNCQQYVEECLTSMFNQDYNGDVEIIVCDDCSTDGTQAVLEKYADEGKILLLKNEANIGCALSRNKCLELASKDFIVIQDADDFSTLDRFSLLSDCLVAHPEIGFVSSGLRCFYEDGSTFDIIPQKSFPEKKDFLRSLPFPHATTMFRREVINSVGGYDNYRRAADYHMFMKIYAKGFRGMTIPDVLYFYRCFKASEGKDRYKNRINEAKIRYRGFKLMGLGFASFPYVVKPLVLGLFSKKMQIKIRNLFNKKHM